MSETHPILKGPHLGLRGDAINASPAEKLEDIQLGPESEAPSNLDRLIMFNHIMLCFEVGAPSLRKASQMLEHVSLYIKRDHRFSMSQSAISRCIARLEEMFHFPSIHEPLFKSKGRGWGMVPTPRCIVVYTTVRAFLIRHQIVTDSKLEDYIKLYDQAYHELFANRQKR